VALAVLALGLSATGCGDSRPDLSFTPSQLPEARTGDVYRVEIGVSGARTPVETIYAADGTLPLGLKLIHRRGDSTATIGGTPREPGRFEFAVAASCLGTNVTGQSGRQAYVLVVK
jgi:hypothetical protein